ncbi:bifunctional diaminohydroxyphosphoribosylaminopyrimidine deaminase/5-amino-6-(5-phosphoribosylamino)uracil reductase RibD [Pedobacter sp. HMF7647]|uniref:Riboflavin biosynthesis protein RibD n=1 Tax=Hufsiella arboris TaxID=2695275 RepID=A0A7K1YCR6_9SPHI|nr:bifunctional diaminohydroxyphosphoribosylaminopyrimidine deaminase/5-amino-6-(5-phosphoribosylamino)uracil reductase RibD [Hufsiella arboris]MXV52171.1 bifunctional diaminohydroxyphosphoribosylaminopyrimidine deaminase/5-amino-6-(5-phosphoribosylamino)uracil reductase RibD [Hufsiella arboris]
MIDHEKYMNRCIELALLAAGNVSPNPMVGAVIVHQDRIIGEGFHQQFGGPHAEVNAVNGVLKNHENAAELLKEATIYVSLEPCAHFGKTPPCADLIIRHEIPNVVIGCRDPFDAVDGKGIEKLQAAGIKVTVGVLENDCKWINRRFFTRVKKQRPYVILKWAQTSDNYFAPEDGSQRWISSAASKKLAHKWRSEEDAILVGFNTARIDNPELTVREWSGKNPKRIVIDKDLSLNDSLNLFNDAAETIVFNSKKTDIQGHIKFLEVENFDHYLPQLILYQLYLMDVQSIIIEGGIKTLKTFIENNLWDEARIFTSNASWANGIKAPQIDGILQTTDPIDTDFLKIYYAPNS